jgi:exopolysaccharide biosynthesis operon protein EpsL
MTFVLKTSKRKKHCIFLCIPAFVSMATIKDGMCDELDTFQLHASVNKMYDSNLFRQSANEVSDQATISTAGLRFNKTYSLQRFIADISYVDNKYNKSDFLDYAATNYNAGWNWSLSPNLTGVLSTARTQRQINFRDLQSAVKNVNTTTENTFRAEYSPHQVLSLIAGYSQIKSENSQSFNAIASNERIGVDYGAKYNFPSGSYISLMGHQRNGTVNGRPLNNLLQFDTGFTDYEYDLEVSLAENGKSNFVGKLGSIEREHDHFSLRDYQAWIGSLNYELLWTGKIKSNVGILRSVGAFETSNSTYSLTDALTASVDYEISEKIQAAINFRLSERDFEGRGQFNTSGRTDKEHSYGARISWRPIKNIGFSLSSTKAYRNSTLSQFDFDDTLTSITVDLRI